MDDSRFSLPLPSPPRATSAPTSTDKRFSKLDKLKNWFNQSLKKQIQKSDITAPSTRDTTNNEQSTNLHTPISFDPNSAKTFLTGNKQIDVQFPQFSLPPTADTNASVDVIIQDSKYLGGYSKFKTIDVNKLRKRLYIISTRKDGQMKAIEKFLKDLNQWSDNPTFISDIQDTKLVVKQLNNLFIQDLQFQKKISDHIKLVIDRLEYVSLKESELFNDGKRLCQQFKKFNNTKLKKGENHSETNFALERLITIEHVYESMKENFQNTLSITMRQIFEELSYEYYSSCEDLQLTSSTLIQEFLFSLEQSNYQKFNNQLDILRQRRNEKIWSQFTANERQNPTRWENLKNGVYEVNDSLLKNIYKNMTNDFKPNPLQVPLTNQPTLNFKSGLDSSEMSYTINSNHDPNKSVIVDKYNPISTNTFLSKETPGFEKDKENDDFEDQEQFTIRNEKSENYPTLNPKNQNEQRQLKGISQKPKISLEYNLEARTSELEKNAWDSGN